MFALSSLVRSNSDNISLFGGDGFLALADVYTSSDIDTKRRVLNIIIDLLDADMVEDNVVYELPQYATIKLCQALKKTSHLEHISNKKYGSEVEEDKIQVSTVNVLLGCATLVHDEL